MNEDKKDINTIPNPSPSEATPAAAQSAAATPVSAGAPIAFANAYEPITYNAPRKKGGWFKWFLILLILGSSVAAAVYFWQENQRLLQQIPHANTSHSTAPSTVAVANTAQATTPEEASTTTTGGDENINTASEATVPVPTNALSAEETARFSALENSQFIARVEQELLLANQEFISSGDTKPLLATLDTLIELVSAKNNTAFAGLLTALQADKEKLSARTLSPFAENNRKVQQLITLIPNLPIAGLSNSTNAPTVTADVPSAEPSTESSTPPNADQSWWKSFTSWGSDVLGTIYEESKNVIVVRPVAQEALEHQAPVVRLQLENRLLQSQFALLAKNPDGWKTSLQGAHALLQAHFVLDDPQVKQFTETLDVLDSVMVVYSEATTSESIAAVRQLAQTLQKTFE